MITPSKQVPKSTITVPDRLVVFTFFSCGALASALGFLSIPELIPSRLCFSVFFSVILLFSFSAFGLIVLPLGFFAFGLLMEQFASACYSLLRLPSISDLRFIFFGALLIPSFFLAGSLGLRISEALHAVVNNSNPTARHSFQKDILRMVFFALFGFAVIFFFY